MKLLKDLRKPSQDQIDESQDEQFQSDNEDNEETKNQLVQNMN